MDSFYLLRRAGRHRGSRGFCFALDPYLPKAWANEPVRCGDAGIQTSVVFREKWRIALEPVDRARGHGLPHAAILMDCGEGDAQEFGEELRSRGEAYIAEVTVSEARVVSAATPLLRPEMPLRGGHGGGRVRSPRLFPDTSAVSPHAIAADASDGVRIRWAEGTKGPLEGEFTRRKVRVCRGQVPTAKVGGLLLEKTSDGRRSRICWGRNSRPLEERAATAHRRFLIERVHEEAKMESGLDPFEGRTWRGLHHHLTLVLIAHTFWVLEQPRADSETRDEPLPTLGEMRRRVVVEVALALVSRVALDRTKKARMAWATAVAHYWAGAGEQGLRPERGSGLALPRGPPLALEGRRPNPAWNEPESGENRGIDGFSASQLVR